MRLRSFWPAVLWSVVILVLSFTSGKSFPSADWMQWFKLDKWIHAFIYLVLYILIIFPLKESAFKRKSLAVYIAALYCLFLGLFTELVQAYLLVDRSGDVPDMVANAFGVVFGVISIRIITKKWPLNYVND